jgi:hypothetical protein
MALRRSPKPGLDRRQLEAAAQLVDDQRGERFALDVLGDDQQWPSAAYHRLEYRLQRLQAGELLFVNQDVGVLELDQHLFRVGDEVRADVAAVELHAFDDVELGLQGLRLLDGDHPLVADLPDRIGEHPPDLGVAVGRNHADLGDLLARRDLLRALPDVLDDHLGRAIDATLQVHRVHAAATALAPARTIA